MYNILVDSGAGYKHSGDPKPLRDDVPTSFWGAWERVPAPKGLEGLCDCLGVGSCGLGFARLIRGAPEMSFVRQKLNILH